MNRLSTVLVSAAVGCLWLGSVALAQRPDGGRRPGGFGGAVDQVRPILEKLELVADQKTKVDEVLKKASDERRAEFEKNMPKLRELRTQIEEAQKANDEAKVTALREEMRKLFGDPAEQLKKLREQLKPLLTDDQNLKLDQALAEAAARRLAWLPDLVLRNAEALKLDEGQKAKVAELAKVFAESVKQLPEGEARAQALKELTDNLTADIKKGLTAEQNTALDKLIADRRGGPGQPGQPGRRPGGDGERRQRPSGESNPPANVPPIN